MNKIVIMLDWLVRQKSPFAHYSGDRRAIIIAKSIGQSRPNERLVMSPIRRWYLASLPPLL